MKAYLVFKIPSEQVKFKSARLEDQHKGGLKAQ